MKLALAEGLRRVTLENPVAQELVKHYIDDYVLLIAGKLFLSLSPPVREQEFNVAEGIDTPLPKLFIIFLSILLVQFMKFLLNS